MKCKICGEEVQDMVQEVSVASFILPRIDNNISRLIEVLRQHFVAITCFCQGGDGHLYRRPTVEIQPRGLAEVDKVRTLLKEHGFYVTTKVTLSDETVTSCNIQLRKILASQKVEDLVVQPGKLISFA
jgi:hypothetical protein